MDGRNDSSIIFKIILFPFFLVLFVAAIIFAGLLIATMGGTKDVGAYKFSILIKEEPKIVYPYLVEFEKRTLWQEGLEDQILLTEGAPIQKGSRALETGFIDGEVVEKETEILKYLPFSNYSIQENGSSVVNTVTYILDDENGTTRLITEGNIVYNDPFEKLLSPLKTGLYKQKVEEDLKNLKLIIENE